MQVKVKVPGGLKFLMHYKKSWLSIFQIFRRQDNFFCNKSIMSRLVTEFANISEVSIFSFTMHCSCVKCSIEIESKGASIFVSSEKSTIIIEAHLLEINLLKNMLKGLVDKYALFPVQGHVSNHNFFYWPTLINLGRNGQMGLSVINHFLTVLQKT